ncbi:hypothetical protein SLS53_000673 [Cytospora paraplurivora]|uniref:Uncharacterized protein n=1 Tax=Cytospora paraplurivora TaxID=2898453 RepID=A0AAN9YN63_9PEZI
MRKGVLLHKLILLELLLGGWQGYNLFWSSPTYGWWLSAAATCLHLSNGLHSVIAWLKIKPFLSKRVSRIFIGTVVLAQPYWIVEVYATFSFFNNLHNRELFVKTRPIETIFRDPWWVAASIKLLWTLKRTYDITLRQVVTISPRFAVMLVAMALAIVFSLLDILSVTDVLADALPVGVNPFWKLSLVFKCLTDTVILDDFKTALDRLWTLRSESIGGTVHLMPRHWSRNGKRSQERSQEHYEQLSLHSSPRGGVDADFEMQRPVKARVLD